MSGEEAFQVDRLDDRDGSGHHRNGSFGPLYSPLLPSVWTATLVSEIRLWRCVELSGPANTNLGKSLSQPTGTSQHAFLHLEPDRLVEEDSVSQVQKKPGIFLISSGLPELRVPHGLTRIPHLWCHERSSLSRFILGASFYSQGDPTVLSMPPWKAKLGSISQTKAQTSSH